MPLNGVPAPIISLLYVDDEPALLDIGKLFLERSGTISVTTASSARQALPLLSRERFDAVVSDYQMPEMNGIDFLQQLRSEGNTIPFIIFTGKGREEVAIEALNSGADFYIQKGGDAKSLFAELEHKVRHAVSRRRSEAQISRQYQFEKTVSALSSRFVESIDFDAAVNASLEDIGRLCGADRAYVYLARDDCPGVDNTHEWCADGVPPLIDSMQNIPEAMFPWWMEMLSRGEAVCIKDVAAMPPEAQAEKEIMQAQAVGSLIVLPLYVKNSLSGIIGFDNVNVWGTWYPDSVDLLRICSEIIGNAIERKRIEDVLRQSEEKYRMLADNTPDFIYSYDASGRFTAANRSLCFALGLTIDEIVGKCHEDLGFPEEMIREWNGLHEKAISSREVVEAETVCLMPDGKIHIYEIVLIPVIDEEGSACGIRGVSRDITGKRQAEKELRQKNDELLAANEQLAAAEEELRQQIDEIASAQRALEQSENRYRGIFEYTGASTIIIEKDTTISLANSAFERLSGYCKEEIEGKKLWPEFVHPDDLEQMLEYHRMRRAGHKDVPNQYEFRYLDKNRTERIIHLTVGSIPGTDQSVASLVDITDWRCADQERSLLIQMLDMAPGSITVHDREGRFLYANQHTFDLHGYSRDEFMALGLRDLDAPSSAVQIETRIRQLLEEGEASFEVMHRRRDSTTFPMIVHARMVNWGEKRAVLSVADDITERKRAEEALQLANRKLHLLSGITRHDILNQVMVLQGALELVRELSTDPVQAEYLQKAVKAAGAIRRQIEFAREYEQLGVSRAEWQLLSGLVAKAAAGRLPVRDELEGLTVYADMMLEQVFANLIDNTLRYGERATEVHTYFRTEGEGVTIVWEDDGVGIPDDQKEKIFMRGYGRNTGLGLFLIREILAITGMTIRETGEYGQGARFEITVPNGAWLVA